MASPLYKYVSVSMARDVSFTYGRVGQVLVTGYSFIYTLLHYVEALHSCGCAFMWTEDFTVS